MLVLNTTPNEPDKVSRYFNSIQKASSIRKDIWEIDGISRFTIVQTVDAVPGKRTRNFSYSLDEITGLLINDLIKKA